MRVKDRNERQKASHRHRPNLFELMTNATQFLPLKVISDPIFVPNMPIPRFLSHHYFMDLILNKL